MAVIISGNGIDMGGNPVSNASQIDSTVINENGDNVATNVNLVGFKNYIINGDFKILQRGTSFSSPGFTADRWYSSYANTVTITNYKHTKVLNVSSSGTANSIRTRLENVSQFSEKTLTLSVNAKYLTSGNFLRIIIGFYDATGTLIGSSVVSTRTISTSYDRYSYTFTCPDLSVHNSGNSYMQIQFDAATTLTNTLSIYEVQLEEGSVATPFENRPYGLELSLCQERAIDLYGVSYRANIVTANSLQFRLPIQLSPLGGVSSLLSGVGDGTDWGIVNIGGTLVTGFTLSLVSVTNGYAQIAASKTSHGLSDGFITFITPNKNILSKEI